MDDWIHSSQECQHGYDKHPCTGINRHFYVFENGLQYTVGAGLRPAPIARGIWLANFFYNFYEKRITNNEQRKS